MVSVKITTNTKRAQVVVDSAKTIRNILEDNNIDYSRTPVFLDGAQLEAGQMDTTLAEFGITNNCILSAIVKTDNA